MNKAQQAKAELKAEQKKNYDEMLKMIAQIENPGQRDINYLQGIMKGKKYNRANRKELTKTLTEMKAKLNQSTETPKGQKAAEAAQQAKDLVAGKDGNLMNDRQRMFKEVRDDLFALAEKSREFARKQVGGTALRLNNVASNLTRLAKVTLRE